MVGAAALAVLVPVAAGGVLDVVRAMGAGRARIRQTATRSAAYDGGAFHNRLPTTMIAPHSTAGLITDFLTRGRRGRPNGSIPLVVPTWAPRAAPLAATWLGHASVLVEVDGHYVLADPVFSDRVSPSGAIGPRRLHPLPMDAADLPQLDAVIISHDHYDHLDTATVDER